MSCITVNMWPFDRPVIFWSSVQAQKMRVARQCALNPSSVQFILRWYRFYTTEYDTSPVGPLLVI